MIKPDSEVGAAEPNPICLPPAGEQPAPPAQTPYVREKKASSFSLRDNTRVLIMGAGVVIVLLLLALNGISNKPLRTSKGAGTKTEIQTGLSSAEGSASATSLTPIMQIESVPREETRSSFIDPEQIERSAESKPRPFPPQANLASIPPFEDRSWRPPSYAGSSDTAVALAHGEVPKGEAGKIERETIGKDSLVFVGKAVTPASPSPQDPFSPSLEQMALPTGTRLRAKLESAVNSAVQTPVIAVIEYNYEQNGEIIVPAGARVTGKMSNADRSGNLEIRFDSLLLPYGPRLAFQAIASDLQLRPLRGQVEGKHTGRNFLVRSAAGVGEIAATLLGRGSLNRPLSEDDLLRERLSTNIGQAADQQITNAAVSARLVVSVPAGTEIYVVVERAAGEKQQPPPSHAQNSEEHSLEQLRQLLKLERELNAAPASE